MASAGKEIDILLAGRSGNGKSATGNSILMHKIFVSSANQDSVTKSADCEYAEFEDWIIKVVDSPGVGDTECTSREGIQLVIDAMKRAVSLSTRGFHAILIIKPYNARFTQEEIDAINILKKIFGEEFITYHAILCLTRGDDFMEEEKETVGEWCEKQSGSFNKLYAECGKRVVLFDNRTRDENIQKQQIRRLLNMIEKLTANGIRYTNEHFQKADKMREAIMNDPAKAFLSEDIIREFGLINQKLLNSDSDNQAESLKQVRELQDRVAKLEEHMHETYKGNALDFALSSLQEVKAPILSKLTIIQNQIETEKKNQELKRLLEEEREAMQNMQKQSTQEFEERTKALAEESRKNQERLYLLEQERKELENKQRAEREEIRRSHQNQMAEYQRAMLDSEAELRKIQRANNVGKPKEQCAIL